MILLSAIENVFCWPAPGVRPQGGEEGREGGREGEELTSFANSCHWGSFPPCLAAALSSLLFYSLSPSRAQS